MKRPICIVINNMIFDHDHLKLVRLYFPAYPAFVRVLVSVVWLNTLLCRSTVHVFLCSPVGFTVGLDYSEHCVWSCCF